MFPQIPTPMRNRGLNIFIVFRRGAEITVRSTEPQIKKTFGKECVIPWEVLKFTLKNTQRIKA